VFIKNKYRKSTPRNYGKVSKKEKSLFKRILKWTGISVLLLLIALILIPIFFKDQLKQLVIDEVNKNLNAKLTIGDLDLTFINTFPNMTVELNDTKLKGTEAFEGVELINVEQFKAHVGFWSVIYGNQLEIDAIHLVEPSFDVRVLNNGLANYDIVKAIISDKVEDVKAELEKRKKEILDEAQKNANKVKSEAKKSADALRAEAQKQAKALMDEAGSNPLKQKAAKISGDKLIKEAEEKAVKIEQEGNKKADAIMREAQEKADKLK
jgi:hypothetical protein